MVALPRNNRISQLLTATVGSSIILAFFFRASITSAGTSIANYASSSGRNKPPAPANATLGFGGLYVVSGPGSSRRRHLEEAAAVTELNLTIPEQIAWTDEDVLNFRTVNQTETKVSTGSAKAWLSHDLVLRAFLESGLETALIFEDDVDWDIRLRTLQVPLAQRAARSFSEATNVDSITYPWGTPADWDLLWLGHCGDYFNSLSKGVGVGHHHPLQLANIQHVIFEDTSMPYRTDLHPFTASLLTAFNVPEKRRVFHQAQFPLCTFGYAVTRDAAEKIISMAALPKDELHPGHTAYDVALLKSCRESNYLKCYSITPELFHHMVGASLIATVDGHEGKVFNPPVDVAGEEQVIWRAETSNIGCGFWSGEFYYNGDLARLEWLQEEVGRKGRCMKAGRE